MKLASLLFAAVILTACPAGDGVVEPTEKPSAALVDSITISPFFTAIPIAEEYTLSPNQTFRACAVTWKREEVVSCGCSLESCVRQR